MRKIIPLIVLLILNACTSQYDELNGHWHITLVSKNDLLGHGRAIIDFEDNFGMWNKNVENAWGGFGIFPQDGNILVSNSACWSEEFTFTVEGDSLSLFKEGILKYEGYKCELQCCNKEKDFFLLSDLKIELPISKDLHIDSQLQNRDFYPIQILIFGKDLNGEITLEFGQDLSRQIEIESWIKELEGLYQYKENGEHKILVYIDKSIQLSSIKKVLLELEKWGVKKIHYATKMPLNLSQEYKPILYELDVKENFGTNAISDNFQNWIDVNME